MKGHWGWIHIKLRELCECGAPMMKAMRKSRTKGFQLTKKPYCSDWERHFRYEQKKEVVVDLVEWDPKWK